MDTVQKIPVICIAVLVTIVAGLAITTVSSSQDNAKLRKEIRHLQKTQAEKAEAYASDDPDLQLEAVFEVKQRMNLAEGAPPPSVVWCSGLGVDFVGNKTNVRRTEVPGEYTPDQYDSFTLFYEHCENSEDKHCTLCRKTTVYANSNTPGFAPDLNLEREIMMTVCRNDCVPVRTPIAGVIRN
jgi:type II secretory pathway pseudopilin PulG